MSVEGWGGGEEGSICPCSPLSRRSGGPRTRDPAASGRRTSGGRKKNKQKKHYGSRERSTAGTSAHLGGQEGQRPLDQESHQTLGVEDELISACLLVSEEPGGVRDQTCHGGWGLEVGVALRGGTVPDDGVQASHLRRALQHAERLGQWLDLLGGGEERPNEGERGEGGGREG